MRKGSSPNTEGIKCLGHSNWTTCSLLSQFCSEIFPTFYFHAPEPISFIPQENEKREFSQHRGDLVPGAFQLDHEKVYFYLCSILDCSVLPTSTPSSWILSTPTPCIHRRLPTSRTSCTTRARHCKWRISSQPAGTNSSGGERWQRNAILKTVKNSQFQNGWWRRTLWRVG